MKIDNVKVYGLAESIVASGLPMLTEYSESKFSKEVELLESGSEEASNHLKRAERLANLGSPHCNYLTGILVVFNVTGTQAFFLQAHRYHWWQVVSSQSKMHRLKKMLDGGNVSLSQKVRTESLEHLAKCNRDDIEDMVYNCPMGLETTEMVSTNYQQLRTIYSQRRTHRLKEWQDFCDWVETLPMSQLITRNSKEQ